MEPNFEHRSGWRRIYPDLPGMGLTSGPEWLTAQDQMLDVVLAFIDAVIAERLFVVAGLSHGGLLARGVVRRRLAWIDGVLLLVPVMRTTATKPPKRALVSDPAFVAAVEAIDAQGVIDTAWFIDMAVVQSPALAATVQALMPAIQRADHAFLARLDQAFGFSFDVDHLPEPFPGPALIVTGRQDHLCGYQDAYALLEHYPRATFAVLDRAGHLIWVEQEAVVTALIRECLDRVEEYARETSTPTAR